MDRSPPPPTLSRRNVLKIIGAGALAVRFAGPLRALGGTGPGVPITGSYTATLIRARDLVQLRFDFLNMHLDTTGPTPRLVRDANAQAAFVVVTFGPQAVAEQAFEDGSFGSRPVRSYLSGPSRLAFGVPDESTTIDFTVPSLLDWAAFTQSVVPAARPADGSELGFFEPLPAVEKPQYTQTAIEAPWRLLLSPSPLGGWAHASEPVEREGRVELWHTRLGVKRNDGEEVTVDEFEATERIVRAVWSPDYRPTPGLGSPLVAYIGSVFGGPRPAPPDCTDRENADPFTTTLSAEDRNEIVHLSAGWGAPNGYVPQPVHVNRLMLSGLGAWLDVDGTWTEDVPAHLSVEKWTHRATMGRDHFVRVVYRGFLYPFGHPASLIKVTERRFRDGTAYLVRRRFIVVRDPVRDFESLPEPYGGRGMPLRRVRLLTTVTPDLADPGCGTFWPQSAGRPVQFTCIGEDREGRSVEFTTPLLFATRADVFGSPLDVMAAYEAGVDTIPMGGQTIAFAMPSPDRPGDTDLDAASIRILLGPGPQPIADRDAERSPLYPVLHGARVVVPALGAVGSSPGSPAAGAASDALDAAAVWIRPAQAYLGGVGEEIRDFATQNPAEVFAELTDEHLTSLLPVPLPLGPADLMGAMFQPEMALAALSTKLGPIGGHAQEALDAFMAGDFDPLKFFLDKATLLGGIELAKVIGKVEALHEKTAGELQAALERIPGLTTEIEYEKKPDGTPDRLKPPTRAITNFRWEPVLQEDDDKFFDPHSFDGTPAVLFVRADVVADLRSPEKSTYDVEGRFENFGIRFVGEDYFLRLDFTRLAFTAKTGASPVLDVVFDDVRFGGDLEFVNDIRAFLANPLGYVSDAIGPLGVQAAADTPVRSGEPSIDVTPAGISIAMSIAVPSINLGAFSLTNLVFSAGVQIPFLEGPLRAVFAISSPDDPFVVSYTFLGGSGSASITVGLDGIEALEFSFEIGAVCSLDLGVASGSVKCTAGVWLRMTDETCALGGFVRLSGELDVLGLVSVSAEFYLELAYDNGSARGQAKLTVTVEVLFVSESVSIKVERRFGGSAAGSSQPALAAQNPGLLLADPDPTHERRVTFAEQVRATDWTTYADAFGS